MRRKRATDGLEDDIRDHIERETEENIERGMPAVEARQAAIRKFGNVARVLEDTREVWRTMWLEQLLQDLRYGARFLARNPRFATVVILTLALGIGVNTAIFSVVNTVLLKLLRYPHAERLAWLGQYDPNIKRDFVWMPDYYEWRKQARSYDGMGAFGYQQAAINTSRGVSQTTGVYVAGDFWAITGAKAALGSLFTDSDPDSVVLTWDFFEREFASNPRVIGQSVLINARPARIAGVLAKNFAFQFPMWWAATHPEPIDAYLSPPRPGEGVAQSTQVVAALKPGIGIRQAEEELRSLEQHLIDQRGGRTYRMTRLHVDSVQEQLTSSSRQALWMLLAAGVFVLLIATVNVANLLLARSTIRQREVAIRAAVGAGRGRVMRQLMAESLLQGLAGGLTGLLLARGILYFLVRLSPHAIPRLSETVIDARVLAFTFGIAVAAGMLFGAAPILLLRRANLHESLKNGARNSGGMAGLQMRRVLVAVELSLSIVLLTGAGLMMKSFARMNAHPPGFNPESILVMKLRFAGKQYLERVRQQAYVSKVLQQLDGAAGTQAAGVSCWVLFSGIGAFPIDTDPRATHVIRINAVSPGYLRALGMSLRKGRWLNDTDKSGVLLNESMAREAFGTIDPIGRQLGIPRPVTIVGVISDVKYSKLDAAAVSEIYVPFEQAPDVYGVEIAVRTLTRAAAAAEGLRKLIADIDPSLPIYDLKALDAALAQSIAPRRFNVFLLGGFAGAALLLGIVGIYGVTAYSVAERTREIGVRMALGARRGEVAAMVVRDALPVAGAGIVAGLAATWALHHLIATLLYDVAATDVPTYASVALLLGIAVVAACIEPARRASAIDPTVALRYE